MRINTEAIAALPIDELRKEFANAVALLESIQYATEREFEYSSWTSGIDYHCPMCNAEEGHQHSEVCGIGKVLARYYQR